MHAINRNHAPGKLTLRKLHDRMPFEQVYARLHNRILASTFLNRKVFSHYQDGKSFHEINEIMGLKTGVSRKIVSRFLDLFVSELSGEMVLGS